MKKVIYLLVLCMVLGMAGCGTNQENKEPVSGNVSVETENKENDDVVQNEQIADTGSYPPCVMVDGVIYKDTGYVASMPGCGTMDGEIVSTVAGTELPSENNQSNFGSGYHYQRSSEGQLIVVIDDERIIFRDIEKDDTSIPIEVINFNAKVKEITDDGELLVTHVSTAEGFCQMNDGEYPNRLTGFVSIDSAPLQRNYVTAVELWLLKRMEPVYAHYPWKLLLKSGTEGVATSDYGRNLMREMMLVYDGDQKRYAQIAGHGFRILAEAMEKNLPYELKCPSLLICGTQDHAGSCIRYNKAWHQKSKIPLKWIEGAGHNSNTDKPELINSLIEEFAAGI